MMVNSENDSLINNIHNVIIIGSGPAAHTAALYCARGLIKPIVIEGDIGRQDMIPGGQLMTTEEIENYPGYEKISGWELIEKMKKQAENNGAIYISGWVTKVDFTSQPYQLWINDESQSWKTSTVIIATGASAKKLDIPGNSLFWNKGISACAVCDGALPIFRNKPLAVIGGGDSALTEALFLTKFTSKVYLIHRRKDFRASPILLQQVLNNDSIEIITDTIVIEAIGSSKLESIDLLHLPNKTRYNLCVSGLFYAIGHQPNTSIFRPFLPVDSDDYLLPIPSEFPGIFAAGDVIDKQYRQAITSASSGCQAALNVLHYLQLH